MPHPSLLPYIDHPNNIWGRVEIMNLIMEFTTSSFISPNILLNTLFSKYLQYVLRVIAFCTHVEQHIVLCIGQNVTKLKGNMSDILLLGDGLSFRLNTTVLTEGISWFLSTPSSKFRLGTTIGLLTTSFEILLFDAVLSGPLTIFVK
jgi:hypothetical protein